MSSTSLLKCFGIAAVVFLASGCATNQPYDYSAFHRAQPRSILILPPVNKSPDIKASSSLLSQMSMPLAEAGYYVFPVGVVAQTFQQNGLSNPEDIQSVNAKKLYEIFGADAALYVEITQYGTSYSVLTSETVVAANAKLVDLRSGETLWEGKARASSAENQSSNNGGLVGMLVKAAINQIVDTISEKGHEIAGVTSQRLLARGPRGILSGPYSPEYGKDGLARP